MAECVTQVYSDDQGGWWRYCLTCDDGSNKHRRHIRGRQGEKDALVSARDHAEAKRKYRIMLRDWFMWRDAVIEATGTGDWDAFLELGRQRFPRNWAPEPVQGAAERAERMRFVHEQYTAIRERDTRQWRS